MFDIRCGGCDRLLGRASGCYTLQIKCPRCRTLHHQTATSCPNPERHRAPRFEAAHGNKERPSPGPAGQLQRTVH
ncbi:Com family DNA-binding transcriptional regulator [Pseudomonas sp. F(2018)]|uniref:Com family DNA-binding transcriptional regulator n=1 Tax=Pseudomonas sp. F(2018) TaxID=2502240 RepID=UPI0010F7E156|nr:Com family DNA-binding transcriptional regulator [Pseudomonas sp. F(2018)]